MKRRFLGIFLALFCGIAPIYAAPANPSSSPGQQQGISWYTNYSQAVSKAQETRKPILLFFTGSDWCGWCKRMHKEVFSSPEFIQEMGNTFIYVDVDFPLDKSRLSPEIIQQNDRLKQKWRISGYPTIVVLSPQEDFLFETGYEPGGGKSYANTLKKLLKPE